MDCGKVGNAPDNGDLFNLLGSISAMSNFFLIAYNLTNIPCLCLHEKYLYHIYIYIGWFVR